MHKRVVAVALALLMATLMVLPAASAQTAGLTNPNAPTPTKLYFHIFDVFNIFPINTQQPNSTFFKVGGTNFPTIAANQWDFNTIRGFSTAGPVEYDFIENGQPRFHPERGIAQDVQIVNSPDAPVMAYMYFQVRDFIGTTDAPDILPFFHVRVQIKEGNTFGQDSNLDDANPIMHGEVCATLSHTPADDVITGVPDLANCPIRKANEDAVVELAIPMTLDQNVIPKASAYNVRIDWWQDAVGTAASQTDPLDDQIAEGFVRIASNNLYNNRLEFKITNPIYISYIHPEVAAGILLIHTAMNSPWGTYDVDVKDVKISVFDANGNPVDAKLERVVSQNSHVHDKHDKPAEITWLWRFRQQKAPDGDYSIKVEVPNNACKNYPEGCAKATGTAGFHLEGKSAYGTDEKGQEVKIVATETDGKSSPAAGLLIVLAVIGLAALARRRTA